MKSNQIQLSFPGRSSQLGIFLKYIGPSKLPSKILNESYETILMERLVIDLSHVWRAHMVYVHWIQHPVN
jgi:hypothetical protein